MGIMVIDTSVCPPPSEPVPKFHIGEREPLFWLISVLFTDQFWQRESLTPAPLGLFGLSGSIDEIQAAKYPDLLNLYGAVEEWVMNNPNAIACYRHVKEALVAGELSYYSPETDEWGEKPDHTPERDIESFPFILWAETNNYPVSTDVVNAVRTAMCMTHSRREHEKNQVYSFPKITREHFEREQKRPLWRVGEAIMFIMGRRARSEGNEVEFGKYDTTFKRLLKYVQEATQAKQLEIIGYDRFYSLDKKREPFDLVLLEGKVVPAVFVNWATGLPVELLMLQDSITATEPVRVSDPLSGVRITMPKARTPEMYLMFAALEHFEKEYPVPKPWPTKTSIVTPWLYENAARFGIEKLSKNMADAIDTLMRPVDSRAGGIKRLTGLNP